MLTLCQTAWASPGAAKMYKHGWSSRNSGALSLIHAKEAWEFFMSYYTKQIEPFEIVNVGVIDTVFDENHGDVRFAKVVGNVSAEHIRSMPMNEIRTYHGTHVAGILGGIHRNDFGLDGMYPLANEPFEIRADGSVVTRSHMYAVSMSGDIEDLESFRNAIDEMLRWDVKVINISMGFKYSEYDKKDRKEIEKGKRHSYFSDDYLDKLAQIIQSYIDMGKDFLIVNSAGNDKLPPKFTNPLAAISRDKYPDVYDRIIIVGNSDNDKEVYWDSNYGERVDIMAPGCDIYSCVPVNGFDRKSGTSQAAPFVAGTACMMWCLQPSLSGAEIKAALIQTAQPDAVKDWRTKLYTLEGDEKKRKYYPLLNAENALYYITNIGEEPHHPDWTLTEPTPTEALLEQKLDELAGIGVIECGAFYATDTNPFWTEEDLTGLLSAAIRDFDGDASPELLTVGFHVEPMDFYGRSFRVLMTGLSMYEVDNGIVVLGDAVSLPVSQNIFGMDYGDRFVLSMPEEFSCFFTSGKAGGEIVLEYHTDYNGYDTSMTFLNYQDGQFSHVGGVGLAEIGEPDLFLCKRRGGADLSQKPFLLQCMGGLGSENWEIVEGWYGEDHNYKLTSEEASPIYTAYQKELSEYNLSGDDARFDFRWDTYGVDMNDWDKYTELADKYRGLMAKQVLNEGPEFFCCLQNYVSFSGGMRWSQRRMDYTDLLIKYRGE